MTVIYPNDQAPPLSLPTLSGDTFTLADRNPENFTIVIFYRGLHCPICKTYFKEVEESYPQFKASGMEVVGVSMDGREKALQFSKDVASNADTPSDALNVTITYGLKEEDARAWGLYISSKREGSQEPDIFSEPGLFVIRPDNTVFMAQIQSAPFTRPPMEQLLGGLKFALENDYPVRGDLTKDIKPFDSQ